MTDTRDSYYRIKIAPQGDVPPPPQPKEKTQPVQHPQGDVPPPPAGN